KTGLLGYVSLSTLSLLSKFRLATVSSPPPFRGLVVLITGSRTATALKRLSHLRDLGHLIADVVVTEGGGRVYWPDGDGGWKEDQEWRATHDLSWMPTLKTWCQENGVEWDKGGYSTAVRLKAPSPSTIRAVTLLVRPSATVTQNMGNLDVLPSTSGKANAASYVLRTVGYPPRVGWVGTAGDDDNDLDLALMDFVDRAYFVRKTGERLRGGEVDL
ncbi:hypothetical protein TrRE_jg7805, partial [Triparma retinervis]